MKVFLHFCEPSLYMSSMNRIVTQIYFLVVKCSGHCDYRNTYHFIYDIKATFVHNGSLMKFINNAHCSLAFNSVWTWFMWIFYDWIRFYYEQNSSIYKNAEYEGSFTVEFEPFMYWALSI